MKYKNKQGSSLVFVMIIMVLMAISGQVLVGSSFKVDRSSREMLNESNAFWTAQGGLAWTQMMLENIRLPFGDKFTLVDVDGVPTWTHDILVDGGTCTVKVEDVSPTSSLFSAFATSFYTATVTGVKVNDTVKLQQDLSVSSLASYITVMLNSGDVQFTGMDDIRGKVYCGTGLSLMKAYGGGYTTFSDDVRVAESYVNMDGRKSDTVTQLKNYDSHVANTKVFQKQIELNAPPVDENNTFNSRALDKIKALAGGSGGLVLPADVDSIYIDGDDIKYEGKVTVYYKKKNNGSLVEKTYEQWMALPSGQQHTQEEIRPIVAHDVAAVYAPGNLTIEGVVDGELSIAVNGKALIGTDGITYESAPNDLDCNNWTDAQKDAIDDTFGLVANGEIYAYGDYQHDADINLHGAYMSITGGLTPAQYDKQDPKKDFRVYGSAIIKNITATENQWHGYGCHWMTDKRFQSGDMAPLGFPHDPYKFSNWRRAAL